MISSILAIFFRISGVIVKLGSRPTSDVSQVLSNSISDTGGLVWFSKSKEAPPLFSSASSSDVTNCTESTKQAYMANKLRLNIIAEDY